MDFNSDDDFDGSNNSYGDNYNSNGESSYGRSSNPHGLSKAELRKTNKPIMEKRRRARINHCLNELKSLILEAMKKDPARHTKLEKADILEMTVKHLQSVQRQQLNMAIQTDPTVIHKFKSGFVECAEEVNRYICQLDGVEVGVRHRLSSHLSQCATSLEQIGSMTNFNNGYRGQLSANSVGGLFGSILPCQLTAAATAAAAAAGANTSAPATTAHFAPLGSAQDLNNNSSNQGGAIQMGGVQLIPSRLPTGEFALIMPTTPAESVSLLNNNNNNNSGIVHPPAISVWPTAAHAAATTQQLPPSVAQLNEFTKNLKSASAFSKPKHGGGPPPSAPHIGHNNNNETSTKNQIHHSSTTATSPPPSPISSASSHGDDSIMHTSSDFAASRPSTPPRDDASPLHSFAGVFATPPSAESSLSLSMSLSLSHLQQQQVSSTSGSGSELNSTTTTTSSLKRSLASEAPDSDDDHDDDAAQPSPKKFAANADVKKEAAVAEERDNMWRPW